MIAAAEQGTIPAADARGCSWARCSSCSARTSPSSAADPRYGDLVNARERLLEQRIGAAAGWLSAGRPRREAGRIAFRIALRGRLLDLRRRDAPVRGGARRAGHARAGHAHAGLHVPPGRAADDGGPLDPLVRLSGAARRGAAALGLRLDQPQPCRRRRRQRLALPRRSRTGSPPCSASRSRSRTRATRCGRPTGWRTLASHAAIAATGASRFAEDLELFGSDEFGLLRIGDELCRASALMPQKRNPYALVVIRGAAATLLGRAAGHAGLAAHAVGPHRQPAVRLRRAVRRGRPGRRARSTLAAATAESVVIDAARVRSARCARASRRRRTSPRS